MHRAWGALRAGISRSCRAAFFLLCVGHIPGLGAMSLSYTFAIPDGFAERGASPSPQWLSSSHSVGIKGTRTRQIQRDWVVSSHIPPALSPKGCKAVTCHNMVPKYIVGLQACLPCTCLFLVEFKALSPVYS